MRKSDHAVLAHYHNLYKGRRAFILGTGPSLLKPGLGLLSKLREELTFGVNYLSKVPEFPFVPDFYCASELDELKDIDQLLAEWVALAGSGKPVARFFSSTYMPDYHDEGHYSDWTWLFRHYGRDMQSGHFNGLDEDLDWVACGHSVVFDAALPVACWMGCDPIYLLGCDATKDGHAHPADVTVRSAASRGRQDSVQRCALTAFNTMKGRGRALLDCSEGGTLPITKVKLKDVLVLVA